MKKMKKVLAILLTMVMALGMITSVFASPPNDPENPLKATGTESDKGYIKVRNISEENNVVVKAYPIVTATYTGPSDHFDGYANPYRINDIANPTVDELAHIAAGKNADGTSHTGGLPTAVELKKTTENGSVVYTNENGLAIGMYLILVEGSEAAAYNPAVAAINYVNKDNQNIIETGDLTMVTSVTSEDAWVKKTGSPDLDKKIVTSDIEKADGTYNQPENGTNGNTANVGDTVTYNVTIDPIPDYKGDFPVLYMEDTLSEGLTYVEDSLKVFIVDNNSIENKLDNNSYTLTGPTENTDGSSTIKVDFVKTGETGAKNYMLNSYAGKKALIEYKAVVNDKAKLNEQGNENKAQLTYSKNSTIDGNPGKSEEKKTHTYTFEIDGTTEGENGEKNTLNIINKVGEKISSTTEETKTTGPIADAEFGLFTDQAATTPYISYKCDSNGEVTSEKYWDGSSIVTDGDGQMLMKGLKAGVYYLKELVPPPGYSLNTTIYKIEIIVNENDFNSDGTLKSWSIKITDMTKNETVTAASFNVKHEGETITHEKTLVDETGYNILNTKLTELPSTGGIGTTIFTIGGCIIMIVAAGLFFASRRKKAEN